MELQKVETQVKAASGFASRNANKERIEQEEAELKVLQDSNKGEEAKAEAQDADGEDGPEPTNPEEKSFKKRYGDLRRHTQKQQADMQKQIEELRGQLDKAATKQLRMPKSEEEIAEWSKEFPDVAKIVETIAMKKAQEQQKEVDFNNEVEKALKDKDVKQIRDILSE